MSDKYKIFEFRIKFTTHAGQDIYIFGDNDDFGNWKDRKFKLDWTEGHIWKKDYKINNNNNKLIRYKFVLVDNNSKQTIWERGPNRILDPNKLDNLKIENDKYIMDLEWERFKIIFNMHYFNDYQDTYMVILGNKNFLGNWNIDKHEEFKMELKKDSKDKDVWKKKITFVFDEGNKDNKEIDCEYKYLIYDYKNKKHTYEMGRINRHFKILFDIDENNDELKFYSLSNPKEYKLLINSILEIDDSNFIEEKL